jgi:alanyl-tRNA synthetase
MPSNEWRGYVLRKIMRRAMRHGKRLGIQNPFLHTLIDIIVDQFGDAYPELRASADSVVQVVRSEEERFDAVLSEGLPRLDEVLDRAARAEGVVSGEAAFKLYDTFGLPRDFIEDMVDERKLRFDQGGFERALEAQRDKSRDTSTFKGVGVREAWRPGDETRRRLELAGDRGFRGYDTTRIDVDATALFDGTRSEVTSLAAGQSGFIALSETPFYLEAGGQVSDVGTISGPNGRAAVTDVIRVGSWPRLHAIDVTDGRITLGERVAAEVTTVVRDATRRNHTATHLLHAALRRLLGPHVRQAGSLVAPDRLRFDFVHFSPVTRDELLRIEHLVNEQVIGNLPVRTDVRNTQEAIAAGAMALFDEKYADEVRVVSIEDFSMELCGGTHTRATGDIGSFTILSESGVAAGVRRIEAVTGFDALAAARAARSTLLELARSMHVRPEELPERVAAQQDEIKRLTRSHHELQVQLATRPPGGHEDAVAEEDVGQGVTLVRHQVRNLDRVALRSLVDQHRDRIKTGVVILASPSDGKVVLVVGVTPDLVSRVPAGQLVKQLAPIVGGGGGGRADFAEAGGKDASKIRDLLAASREVVTRMLAS